MIQRACAWGGEGTPEVSEYCAAELGALHEAPAIADALDCGIGCHGCGSVTGECAWQPAGSPTNFVVGACADDHASAMVDDALPRFAKILPPIWKPTRPPHGPSSPHQDVFSFDSDDGLKTIIAKAAAGDAIWFLATINRIAEILAAEGDTDPIGTRRARAIGILAQPAEALRLLIKHQHEPAQSAEGNEPGETAKPADPSESGESTMPGDPSESGEPTDTVDVDPMPEPETEQAEPQPAADDHQSLSTTAPPGFDAHAARPRAVLHFHLAEAALRTGHAIVRPEDGNPITLNQLAEFLSRTADARSASNQCSIPPR